MNETPPALKPTRISRQREIPLLLGLLIVAAILFALGIFLPMLTLSKFIVIKNSFSVVSGVVELLQNGQILVFIIVTSFSIVLPIFKIAFLFKLLRTLNSVSLKTEKYLYLMHEYGRWAMLDVMVVAILIVTVKLGAVASIQVHSGLYVFGSSVLLIMLITHRVVKLTNKTGN